MRLLIFIISSLMLVLGSCCSTQKTVAEIEDVSVEAMPNKPDTTTQRKPPQSAGATSAKRIAKDHKAPPPPLPHHEVVNTKPRSQTSQN